MILPRQSRVTDLEITYERVSGTLSLNVFITIPALLRVPMASAVNAMAWAHAGRHTRSHRRSRGHSCSQRYRNAALVAAKPAQKLGRRTGGPVFFRCYATLSETKPSPSAGVGSGLLATAAMSAVTGRWYYFAYGSNLNSDVFEGRRGVTPLDVRVGVLEGYRLAFNMPGVPLLEPSFASVEPSEGDEVHGVVFTLDWPGWVKVCRSEGVPFGYNVEPVAVSLYSGEHIEALTLRTAPSLRVPRERETNPSARYFGLIFHGAMERGLSPEWQQQLQRMVSL